MASMIDNLQMRDRGILWLYQKQTGNDDAQLTPLLRLGAGACAGIIATSATYPMDLVRGRLTFQEEETGKLVGDIDFYELSHTTKDGNIVDKEAEKILNEAKEILAEFKRENPEATSEELVARQAEIMSKVKGKEARGRVCGRGLGPSQVEIGLSRDEEGTALRNKVAHLEVQVQIVPKLKGQLEKVLDILEECGINLDDDGSENGEDGDGGNGV